jgi:hypothetical protein
MVGSRIWLNREPATIGCWLSCGDLEERALEIDPTRGLRSKRKRLATGITFPHDDIEARAGHVLPARAMATGHGLCFT